MQTVYHRTVREDKLRVIEKPLKGSWVCVTGPNEEELLKLEQAFNLDADLLDDGIDLYESPRLEHEDGTVYIYVRFCRPQHGDSTSTQPLLLVVTDNNLISVSRIAAEPVEKLIKTGQLVTTQKVKLVLEILEQVNHGYRTYLNSVTRQILLSRSKMQHKAVSNIEVLKLIDMEEDLNEFLAALQPYDLVLQTLVNGKYIKMHERDEDLIEDLQLSTRELIELTKSRLKTIQNIREAYTTIATNNLNQIFKRLTSIAIFMSIPTIVGGFYGMNVALPFEDHPSAFWIVSSITLSLMLGFIAYFKNKKWL